MSKVFNMVGGGGGKNISSIIITGLESTDTITCTKDGKSYAATWDEAAQHWEIVGLPFGTFTLTATNGTKTITKTVLIDVSGVYEVEMTFKLWLYHDGDECEDVTGGWEKVWFSNGSSGTANKNSDSLYMVGANASNWGNCGFATKNAVSTTDYTKLYARLDCVGEFNSLTVVDGIGNQGTPNDYAQVILAAGNNIIVDASSLIPSLNGKHLSITASYYNRSVTVYEVWLE